MGRTTFERLAADGRQPLGVFVMSGDSSTTAIFGSAGFDFVIIDREHGMIDIAAGVAHVRAAAATDTVAIVRILSNDPALIQQALDMGAQGIVVPKVESAEGARAAVQASRYQAGGRGRCSVVPAVDFMGADWDSRSSYVNENVIVIPLIETQRGVENVDAIAAVDGVDYLFFGHADLSQDMGEDLTGDRLIEVWRQVADAAHARGVRIGAAFSGAGERGADFVTVGADLKFVSDGALQVRAAHRARLEGLSAP